MLTDSRIRQLKPNGKVQIVSDGCAKMLSLYSVSIIDILENVI